MAGNEITAYLVGKDRSFGKTLKKGAKDVDTLDRKLSAMGKRMSRWGSTLTTRVTLPIIAGLTMATKAGVEEDQQMAVLEKIVRKNTGATKEQVVALEAWIAKMQQQSTFSDGQLRPAMQALVAVTKDVGEAQHLTTLAMDLAVAKGKPVETMAEALAKAYNGNVGILSRYGIATRDATGKSLDFAAVVKNAEATFGGTYATALDTSAGKLANLKNRFGDITEDIGRAVIPMLETLVPHIERVAKWFENLSDGQRSFLVKAALGAAAAGPIMLLTGKFLSLAGALMRTASWLGKVARGIGLIKAAGAIPTFAAGGGPIPGMGKGGAGLSGLAKASLWTAAGVAIATGITLALRDVAKKGGWDEFKSFWTGGESENKQRFDSTIKQIEAHQAKVKAAGGEQAWRAGKRIDQAMLTVSTKGVKASGKEIGELTRDYEALAKLTEKPLILGKVEGKHTDAQLRTIRDRMMTELGITQKRADRIMAMMFKDWRPQDQLNPKLDKATKQAVAKLDTLRRKAAKNIKLGRADNTKLLDDISRAINKLNSLSGAAYQAHQVLGRLSTVRGPNMGGGGRLQASGGGTFSGPSTGYPVTLHRTETVVDHDSPTRGLSNLAKFGILGGGLSVTFANCNFGYDPDEVGDAIESAAARSGLAMARA